MPKIKRPLIRYHGGKFRQAKLIIEQFPNHRAYVEPFGGAGSVLLQKPRSSAEVYNDIDSQIVNLFNVVRDRGEELERAVYLTPYSRTEFDLSQHPSDDPLEQARRTVIRASMGFGTNGLVSQTGFRSYSGPNRGTTPAHDWQNYPAHLPNIIERLRGVIIENLPAIEVIRQHDSRETLFYVDPPYLANTRSNGLSGYAHEMTVDEHKELAKTLNNVSGLVVVSGYPSELYDDMYSNWHRVEQKALADGARPRIEVLWMNFEDRGQQTCINF